MSNNHPPQASSIAKFIATSRNYLGLPARRRHTLAPRRHWRRSLLRLALLASSLGSLISGAAFAEHAGRTTRNLFEGTASVSPANPIILRKNGARSSIERMP